MTLDPRAYATTAHKRIAGNDIVRLAFDDFARRVAAFVRDTADEVARIERLVASGGGGPPPPAGFLSVIVAAVAGVAEGIAEFGVSDAAGRLNVENAATIDGEFQGRIRGVPTTDYAALTLAGDVINDGGYEDPFNPRSLPGVLVDTRLAAGGPVVGSPLLEIRNDGTMGANFQPGVGVDSAMLVFASTFIGGNPPTSGRSAGTRIVFRDGSSYGLPYPSGAPEPAIGIGSLGLWIETGGGDLRFVVGGNIVGGMDPLGYLMADSGVKLGNAGGGPRIEIGNGSPEGIVGAELGSLYLNALGGVGASLYIKEDNPTYSTGWAAK